MGILTAVIGSIQGAPTYTLLPFFSGGPESVNEGSGVMMKVGGTNVPNGTYYWTIQTNAGDFITDSGTVSVTGNTGPYLGSFTVSPTADSTTEGVETFTVALRTGSITGPILVTSDPITINDTSFLIGGSLIINANTRPWATTNAAVPTYGAYTYPDETSGSLHSLTGTQYVLSELWGTTATICFNLWFYPTANNKIIMVELGQSLENSGFHYSMLEINSSNRLKGRTWGQIGAVTSTGSVTLNAWNHVYFYFDNVTSTFSMSLNNETAVTQGSVSKTLSSSGYSYWGIGLVDSTNMGSSARYQGKFDALVIDTTLIGSTYTATKAKYLPPFSLSFPLTGDPYLLVSNTQSDWNLGSTYTIEFWSKETNPSTSSIRTVASQGPGNGIDLGFMYGGTLFRNTQNPGILEPNPGVWSHVAFVGNSSNTYVYHNGVLQGTYTSPGALGDGSNDLNIGRRAGVNGQGFRGKLAMIRISNTAKYLDNFSPSISYDAGADTKLMLGGTTPLTDLSQAEVLSGVPVYTNGNGNLYILKSLYPDLDTQVQVGDTITAVGNSASVTTVRASVFLSDPSAWGIPTTDPIYYAGNLNITRSRHPISVQGSVTTSPDFPSFQSLEFNQPQGDFLNVAGGNDWNLGTTGTIEFWIKANNASSANINIPGGQWALLNQGGWYYGMPDNNSILIGLAGGYLSIAQSNVDAVEYTEPTAGVWTHLAVVYNSGTQKVYYNGVEQTKTSGNYSGNGWSNATSNLYIGRLAPNYGGHFDGKLAMVRISNTAKYLTAFTATTTYGVEGDTRLFLSKVNPTVDSNDHIITNNGVTTSTDFPA
jgi:hypothetical protein